MNQRSYVKNGFTLIELLTALAIISIIIAFALPDFSSMLKRQQASSKISDLHRLLNYARATAISLNKTVIVCASIDGEKCKKNKDWSEKTLLVFSDNNNNKKRDNNEEILRVLAPTLSNTSLHYRAFGNKSYIQWRPNGSNNYQNGNIIYCPSGKQANQAKGIIINRVGRMYFANDKNQDGIIENGSGDNVSCSLS